MKTINETKDTDRAFMSPAMPCNPVPFLVRMQEIVKENGTNATDTVQFRSNLLVVMQQTFGQLATIDLCDLWTTCKDQLSEVENFKVHGVYTVSNAGGYEIELSDSGDMARMRDAYGSDVQEISDWFEIQYITKHSFGEIIPVIDPDGYNIPLNQVIRVNY